MTSQKRCEGCQDGAELPFEFKMAFHPIVDMNARRVWGYEALVRGPNGEGAGSILAQVDDTNRYKFDQACRVKSIEAASRLFREPHLRLSINFMPNAVYEPAACIRASLAAAEKYDFARERIVFEFTENEKMVDTAHVLRIIAEYRRLGFTTALDDFGAGYAGLGLLADFQPDMIKIDMHLLRDIHRSPARQAIVGAIMDMARRLDITVLAEGIETAEEMVVLRAAGISLMQGYLFAKPALDALPPVHGLEMPTAREAVA